MPHSPGTNPSRETIQLLKFLGFTRIVAYASSAHFADLKHRGATEFIDRADGSLTDLAVHPPVKVVYDTTFGTGALNAARTVGLVHVQGFFAGPDVTHPSTTMKGHPACPEYTPFGKLLMKNLPEMLKTGVIVPYRVEVVPNGLAKIPAALDKMKAGGVSDVELVAHPHDSTA
ncbi:hypothetical protein DFH07DRAFT_1058321 [Mycena maculata]|uniref:Alcohol dehydrogenase-like C-terminal domain-containing protein n=1 Tax=Mycena maculata TaxID=230809 RepID=A0AAD7JNN5_9AGAR|nr:hypothetical protein DFH07DRAFT_1058321 [Mycena maculata]